MEDYWPLPDIRNKELGIGNWGMGAWERGRQGDLLTGVQGGITSHSILHPTLREGLRPTSLCPGHAFILPFGKASPTSFILPFGKASPTSFIPHPSSLCPGHAFILHPSSFIRHPSSLIPHPSSFIPHPSSFILHPSPISCIIQGICS